MTQLILSNFDNGHLVCKQPIVTLVHNTTNLYVCNFLCCWNIRQALNIFNRKKANFTLASQNIFTAEQEGC